VVLSRAWKLAIWVGAGRQVTAKGVLRPADVAEVTGAIGVAITGRVRSAADVPALHRSWVVAQAAGQLVVDGGQAVAGSGAVDDPLQAWLAGLDAVLREESQDRSRSGAALACLAVLAVLSADPPPPRERLALESAVYRLLESGDLGSPRAAFTVLHRSRMSVATVLEVLAEFDAVDEQARVTPLGRWAQERLRERVGTPVTPALPAEELLPRLAAAEHDEESWELLTRWCGARPAAEAAAELLRAAATATVPERVAAVDTVAGLGEEAVPAWQAVLDVPELAVHARTILADWQLGPQPDAADQRWLVVECALLALARDGAEAAYHDAGGPDGLANIEHSGHPDEDLLRAALTEFAASGSRGRAFQLKIELTRTRPTVWRRVAVPASITLGDLHALIRVILGWGTDHMHAFTAGDTRYSDPYYGLEDCDDEDLVRLSRVLPKPGAKMIYVYDFGDWWEHTITLEKITAADPAATYPTCLAGHGAAPVEDWNPEYPEDPVPFDRDDINRRLVALTTTAPSR
jgi:Plasmid pRiA4b ORF-3-like protein